MQKGDHTSQNLSGVITSEAYNLLLTQNSELRAENLYLKQELDQLKRMIFGSKSERHTGNGHGQLSLGLEAEMIQAPEKETQHIAYTRNKPENKKGSPVRLALPSHLHREEHTIKPAEDITGARKIGEVITEVLEYTPGKFYVEKYIRPKYVLPKEEKIVIGELTSLPIPRGNAGAGLLSHLLISKFTDHLPFYRQVQQFKRQDIDIAESTISGWFTAACRLLEPLYERLAERTKGSSYLMADETPIPVQTKDKPGSTHKGYHWVYYAPMEKLVCFDYRRGRGREGPDKFLEHFQGRLQVDGYNAYDIYEKKAGITLHGCVAHARRKFESLKDNDPGRAEFVLDRMKILYMIEREARENNLSFEDRQGLALNMHCLFLKNLRNG
jgi:transposase